LFSESDLVRFFHSLAETETKLRAATQPRYQLEIGIVKLMELRGVESISELMQRLATLEGNLGGEPPSTSRTPSGSSGTPSKSERSPATSRSAGSSFTAAAAVSPALEKPVEEKLEAVAPPAELSTIDRLKAVLEGQRKMLLVTALEAAQATVFDESELCIEFAPASRHFRDTLSRADNNKFVRDACREVTGRDMGVWIVVKDPSDNGEPPSREDEARLEKQRRRENAANHPNVQTMLKTFRGEISEVYRDGER
jgi:DNA polymerase III gamma/tau subunit